MKKGLVLLLAVFLVLGFLAGCSSDDAATPEATPEVVEETNAVQAMLDEYADELLEELAPMVAMMGDDITLDLQAGAGNELIYVFTYSEEIETAGTEEILQESLEGLAPMFEPLAGMMRDELELEDFRITVRMVDFEGNVLAEVSFDA